MLYLQSIGSPHPLAGTVNDLGRCHGMPNSSNKLDLRRLYRLVCVQRDTSAYNQYTS